MKLKNGLFFINVILITFILISTQVSAAADLKLQSSDAAALQKLDIMHKDAKGSLRLKDKMKRCEFIAAVNSAMSYDLAADAAGVKITYKDLSSKHWAVNDIKTAVKHNLIVPYSDNTIRPDKFITNAEALDILINALGYKDTVSNEQDSILKEAAKLGITGDPGLKSGTQLTRGDASIILYNALTVDFAG
jgi:hypothetical protein